MRQCACLTASFIRDPDGSGEESIRVGRFSHSDGWNYIIEPKERVLLRAYYDPRVTNWQTGHVERLITITSNDPIYFEMGPNQKTRQKAYHDLVEDLIAGYISKKQLHEFKQIEKATCYFGSPDFVKREHKKLLERLKIRSKKRGEKRSFDPPWNSIK